MATAAGLMLSSCLVFGVSPSATQRAMNRAPQMLSATVTLQGCVVAGEAPGTFVFTSVHEWPMRDSPMGMYGPRHYWFHEMPANLQDHIGQTIQVKGSVVDIDESEVEREPGGWNGGTRVAIELPGRDVITSPKNAGVPQTAAASHLDMKITLLRFHVDEFMVVMKTCLPKPEALA